MLKSNSDKPNALPGKNISTEHTSDNVPQMRYIINIGQGAGDQNVPLPFQWKTVHESSEKQASKQVKVIEITIQAEAVNARDFKQQYLF